MHSHHHHSHGHDHQHGKSGSSTRIKAAFFINLAFTLIEIIGGLLTNSVAILSDALHDFGDSVALGLSWFFEKFSKKKRDKNFSYGYGRFSLLSALINCLILILGSVFILTEAIPRLVNPVQPDARGMILLSILGISANGIAVWRLQGGKSMNEKMVRWHLLEDVFGWVAVLIASVVMLFIDLPVLDPLLSIAITGYILYNVIKNLGETSRIFLQGKPKEINEQNLISNLEDIDGIMNVHDAHIWSTDGAYHIMSVHIVVADDTPKKNIISIKEQVRHLVQHEEIQHLTVEVEFESEKCLLEDC